MFAHTRDDVKIFAITSPKENNETCIQFVFNAHVGVGDIEGVFFKFLY